MSTRKTDGQGREFDEKAATEMVINQVYHWSLPMLRPKFGDKLQQYEEKMVNERLELMRWQFNQDKAALDKLVEAEKLISRVEEYLKSMKRDFLEYESAEVDEIEDSLKLINNWKDTPNDGNLPKF